VLIDVEPLCWPGVVVCGGACKARGGTGPQADAYGTRETGSGKQAEWLQPRPNDATRKKSNNTFTYPIKRRTEEAEWLQPRSRDATRKQSNSTFTYPIQRPSEASSVVRVNQI